MMIKELTAKDTQNISGGFLNGLSAREFFDRTVATIPESDGEVRSSSTFTGSQSQTRVTNRVTAENGESSRTQTRETTTRPLTQGELRSRFGF